MCLIRSTTWMGTSTGNLRILHAPTLKLCHSWKLPSSDDKPSSILKILHVQEMSCVLVTTHGAEIWSLHDRLVGTTGLQILQHMMIEDCPVYDLVKVNMPDGRVEVWGTMDNNTLILLELDSSQWKWSLHTLEATGYLKYCSHIVCCSFTNEGGKEERHLWVSYRNRGGLISFDTQERKQRCLLSVAQVLKNHHDGKCCQ